MNPFTESTVARPLSEPRRQASNDAASPGGQDASHGDEPGVPAPPPAAVKRRRLVRDPRSVRLARRAARDAARKQSEGNTPFLRQGAGNRLGPVRRSVAARWSAQCRGTVGALLGMVLALGVSAAWAVNVNSAGAQELETITGIGPKTAQTIVDERTRGGSFESFEDLAERVKGIGPKKAKSLQAAGLTVGAGGSAPKAPVPAVQRKAGK
ncbi:ComEA family DNA-binding protein [Pusillimonas sp.]|uniref:ComEA family DNA-binding protein n=1 Tax=Pusillimonas sp. TaxID=3040095 RepID=UPI0037CB6301